MLQFAVEEVGNGGRGNLAFAGLVLVLAEHGLNGFSHLRQLIVTLNVFFGGLDVRVGRSQTHLRVHTLTLTLHGTWLRQFTLQITKHRVSRMLLKRATHAQFLTAEANHRRLDYLFSLAHRH